MLSTVERRTRRWLLRRIERQTRRRRGAPPPGPVARVTAAASLVDGYCEALGPAGNDDLPAGGRRGGPPLTVVRP